MKPLLAFVFCLMLAAPAFANEYYVVTGSFESEAGAQEQLMEVGALSAVVKDKAQVTEATVQGQKRFRVSIGPFNSIASAKQTQLDAIQKGFAEAWTLASEAVEHTMQTIAVRQPERDPRISEQSSVEISRFIYDAPALEAEIAALLLAVTGKPVETSVLLATKDKINQLYLTNGYVNTGVVIPDQQIRNGELKLDFISGEITEVQISSDLR